MNHASRISIFSSSSGATVLNAVKLLSEMIISLKDHSRQTRGFTKFNTSMLA